MPVLYTKLPGRVSGRLAWLFPLLSPLKSYIRETKLFCRLIRKHSKIRVRTLLHMGCGAGHNDSIFKKYFLTVGVTATFLEIDYDPDPADTSYETDFIFLVRRSGKLEVYADVHPCGLFRKNTIQEKPLPAIQTGEAASHNRHK